MACYKQLNKLALLTVCTFFLSGVFSPVLAKTKLLGEKSKDLIEATKKASNYFFESGGGIGILIAYGTGNGEGVTAESIGDQFVKELKHRGKNAKYFYYVADWEGMAMKYLIGHATLGPWEIDDAASNINKAIEMADAAKRIHSQ